MGSFSIGHFIVLLLPVLVVGAIAWLVLRRSRKFDRVEPTFVQMQPVPQMPAQESDKVKWLAAAGYIFAMIDAFMAHLVGIYQLDLFGYKACLIAGVPFVIYYLINRDHPNNLIASHLGAAIRLYAIFVFWSVVNGVLLGRIGVNLTNAWLGGGVSIMMLGVLVWLSIRCVQGIVAAFELRSARAEAQSMVPLRRDR